MRPFTPASLLILSVLMATPLAAQADRPGSKDHPLFTRMPGFFINGYKAVDFDRAEFFVEAGKKLDRQKQEGKKTELQYQIKKGAKMPSGMEIIRNHQNAIKAVGGEVLWEKQNSGFQTTLRLKKDGAEYWVDLHPYSMSYNITIIEKGAMEQKISSNAMLDALNKDGFIALDIHFDTNKATIMADSQGQVAEIAALLKANPKLKVSVEGHTDASGTSEGNRKLSDDRAKAVKAALVAAGIEAGRLQAKGFGQDKPVADNRTEAGRAKNRRVDVVILRNDRSGGGINTFDPIKR